MISNNGPPKHSQKQLLPFSVLIKKYRSTHGKVINQAKFQVPRGLELKWIDFQAKKLLDLSD